MTLFLRGVFVAAVQLLAAVLCTSVALAQAGGGGAFGGGGGGGGDGGAVELLFYLVRFTIYYPQYGIPIWIVLGIGYVYVHKTGRNVRITRTIRRGRKAQETTLRAKALESIRSRDPAFTEAVFLERAANGFVNTQYAWSNQDLRTCRAFVSDGVYQRFALYIEMQKAENIRNRMKNVQVRGQDIVAVTSDLHFDTIHVRFEASAISYNEDLDSGRRVGGNSDVEPIVFTEIWSFSRRPGVATDPGASLLEGNCPNCGGPVGIVDLAQCPHCESVVNSGQYDWILAEITQAEEWVVPPVTHNVPGWDELAARDPALNFQHLEDRASVAFWRCLMSVYFEDDAYATPILSAERHDVPRLWNLPPGRFWMTPAVGMVEIRHCRPATADDAYDRVFILIRWSGRRAEGNRRRPRQLDEQRIYSHVMVLKRRAGATSNIDAAFASFNCHNCGAPIDVGSEAACKFCRTTLNDGSNDWVLEDVTAHSALTAYRREDKLEEHMAERGRAERLELDRFVNEPELLATLARLVSVDGELHEKEMKYLTTLATRRGVTPERLQDILNAATADDQPIAVPQASAESRVFMDHLIRAALLDGRVTRGERKILAQVGAQLAWSRADLDMAIARNRKELYQQAKSAIKAHRHSKRRGPGKKGPR